MNAVAEETRRQRIDEKLRRGVELVLGLDHERRREAGALRHRGEVSAGSWMVLPAVPTRADF